MENNGNSGEFDMTRTRLFEAISHPVRIKILRVLGGQEMSFQDLREAVNLENDSHLSFHLMRLGDLVHTTSSGMYGLTDEGKEALWSVDARGDVD
jgi:DNA-binding transcriptional ArsR family regulator